MKSLQKLLLPKREAAQALGGISVRFLDELLAKKVLKSIKVGRRRMIPLRELERFSRIGCP
jgi:excisionase family DNA binding protein